MQQVSQFHQCQLQNKGHFSQPGTGHYLLQYKLKELLLQAPAEQPPVQSNSSSVQDKEQTQHNTCT